MLDWIHKRFIMVSPGTPTEPVHFDPNPSALRLMETFENQLLDETKTHTDIQLAVPDIAQGAVVVLLSQNDMHKTYGLYNFADNLPDYLPIANDGGGKVLAQSKDGLYAFDVGDLDIKERIFIAPDLRPFLIKAEGLDVFLSDYVI